ncbi:MAG: T9SS type A sorting domain-containing protein [Bacteroidetes bacterium]|nr:T9SS type A sorting domain-containing protein [Bacteroidota bacterium]
MKESRSFGKSAAFAAWGVLVASVLHLPPSFAQTTPIVVFNEDDGGDAGYYDASFGTRQGSSLLTLAGSGNDKLPIITGRASSGTQCGLLQWTSGSGALWGLYIASPGWVTRDASGYDSLTIMVNGPSAIDTAALPWINLESSTNQKPTPVSLATFFPQGLDADTSTWQKISIPLTAFEPYGTFLLEQFKDFWFSQRAADNVQHTMWFDDARLVGEQSTSGSTEVRGLVARAGDRSMLLHWDPDSTLLPDGYHVYRATDPSGPYTRLTAPATPLTGWSDVSVSNGVTYWYYVRAVGGGAVEGPPSDTIAVSAQAFASDSDFLDYVQRAAIDYFWYEANPVNGLIRDRSQRGSPASVAAIGFGLSAINVGIDRGWIARSAGRDRVLATLRTFWYGPQGTAESGTIGYRGFFYHFLEMASATRMVSWNSELSSIDTGLLLAGILDARQYFDGPDSIETQIRSFADSIYGRVEWDWMCNGGASLTHGWQPSSGFIPYRWIGYNEAMILYLLAMGAPNHAIPASAWSAWTSGYAWFSNQYGYSFVGFPPLFGHQFSHCWVDFRGIADSYMTAKGMDYAENTRRATLAQQAYCVANPGGFTGYGSLVWGLTACDGPTGTGYLGYSARGAPGPGTTDDGTIAPSAVAGSMPFTPEISVPTLRNMYEQYRATIWTPYGFADAFNLQANWWDPDVIGIDQGLMALMIENYRSGALWNRGKAAPEIVAGLSAAGFTPLVSVPGEPLDTPLQWALEQNYPNPFNPATTVQYQVPVAANVNLTVTDLLGREIAVLVNEQKAPGRYVVRFDAGAMASGFYLYTLKAAGTTQTRKMLYIK